MKKQNKTVVLALISTPFWSNNNIIMDWILFREKFVSLASTIWDMFWTFVWKYWHSEERGGEKKPNKKTKEIIIS